MNAEAWKRELGEEAWNHLVGAAHEDVDEKMIDHEYMAQILTAATEVGFTAPPTAPRVAPGGTRVMFPGHEPALTARGLLEHWKAHGHGWVIFRCEQLARAIAGPMLPRMQEIANAYEAQCDMDKIDHVEMVPADWIGFVGGSTESQPPVALIMKVLMDACVPPTVMRKTVKGPGDDV